MIADMEWSLVVTAWALIAAGIIGAGLYLQRAFAVAPIDPELRGLLQRRDATHQTLVSVFLSIFDGLFGGGAVGPRSLSFEKTLWVGVVLAPAIVFILRFGTWIVGRSQPSKLDLLLVAIGISFVYSIILWLWLNMPRRMRSFDVFPAAIFVALPLVGLPALFVGLGVADSLSIWRLAVIAIGVLYVNGLVWIVAVLIAPFRQGDGFGQFPINLWKVIVTSAFFMAVVSLIRWDAATSFFDVIEADGPIALTFIAYSVFADGISLIKTRWLLQRAIRARAGTLFGILAADLALSAGVFVLPTTMWELPTFWDAIVFRGDRPWLGVLFWSTLSTSALFYLFAFAAALAGPISRVAQGLRLRPDAEPQPVLALTASAVVCVTIAFLMGTGVTLLVTGSG